MKKEKFGRIIVSSVTEAPNVAGGTTVIIDNAFPRETVDYTDIINVRVMATNAVHTANGLYEMISNNCNMKKPSISTNDHLEIYLALAGLACEIYMKSIIYNEFKHNGQRIKIHFLNELYGMLPNNVKIELEAKIPQLEDTIIGIKDIFIKLRYDFESNNFNGNYLAVFELMEELKSISNKYPTEKRPTLSYSAGKVIIE